MSDSNYHRNYRKDGSPVSSNAKHVGIGGGSQLTSVELQRIQKSFENSSTVYIATVRDIIYPDNERNISKNHVEYKIRIESGDRKGSEYLNVQAMNFYGGVVSFSETVYLPRTKALNGVELQDETEMYDLDATQVLVAFIDTQAPIIIGGVPNTNQFIFHTEEDGLSHISEFNGLRTTINKDGEFELVYFGGQRDVETKETVNKATAPTTFKIAKDGTWHIDDKENQKIEISRTKKQITIEQKSGQKSDEKYVGKQPTAEQKEEAKSEEEESTIINQIVMDKDKKSITTLIGEDTITKKEDGTEEVTTRTYKSGLVITEDGKNDKVNITTAAGVSADIDGQGNKIVLDVNGTIVEIDGESQKITMTAGSALIEIDGASGKIHCSGSLVDIGQAASAAAALGPQLLSWLNSHTHLYGPTVVPTPTSPPVVPAPASVLSTTVKIQP